MQDLVWPVRKNLLYLNLAIPAAAKQRVELSSGARRLRAVDKNSAASWRRDRDTGCYSLHLFSAAVHFLLLLPLPQQLQKLSQRFGRMSGEVIVHVRVDLHLL